MDPSEPSVFFFFFQGLVGYLIGITYDRIGCHAGK